MRLLTAGLFGLVLGTALPAQAQSAQYGNYGFNLYGPYDPYGWSLYNEGPGIKFAGDGMVFHPGAEIGLGYDSNILLDSTPVGGGVLTLRAHLDLATLPPQRMDAQSHPKVEFRLGGAFEYRQYFSGDDRVVGSFGGNPAGARQFNGFSDIYLGIKPRDPLSLRLYNNLIVTNDARNLEALSGSFAPRLYERFGLLGTFRPNNGPLEIGLGDAVRLDYYFDSGLAGVTVANPLANGRSVANDANLYAQWTFLPQSSLKLEVRSTYVTYFDATSVLPSAVPIRATLGINSLIVPALGVTAYAGYGNSLQIGADQGQAGLVGSDIRYNNFVGGAELRLRLLLQMKLALGWARDFYDSIYASYLADDRVYLHYDHNLYRGLSAHLSADAYFRKYGALVDPAKIGITRYGGPSCPNGAVGAGGSCSRSDIILNLGAELDYRPLSWMQLGVSYSLLDDITDFTFDGRSVAFLKHLVMAKVDIAY